LYQCSTKFNPFYFSAKNLNLKTKTNKIIEDTYHKDTNATTNMSDEEYYNFSDSSLELFDTFEPRSKKTITFEQKLKSEHTSDHINLTNESKLIEKKNSLSVRYSNSSIYNDNSSSNDSFKSTSSFLGINDENNVNKVLVNFNNLSTGQIYKLNSENDLPSSDQITSTLKYTDTISKLNHITNESLKLKNNYSTPKDKHILSKNFSDSAKLLDSIYGKEWRHIDGVIKEPKKKNLNNDLFEKYNE